MFTYKKFSFPMIFTMFFPYSTNKIESPCANPRYSHSLKRFSYLLTAVDSIYRVSNGVDDGDDEKDEITARPRAVEVEK